MRSSEYPGVNTTSTLSFPGDRSVAGAGMGSTRDGDQTCGSRTGLRVQSGDTLLTKSRAPYLGSNDDVDRLIRANPKSERQSYLPPARCSTCPAAADCFATRRFSPTGERPRPIGSGSRGCVRFPPSTRM